MLIEVFEKNKKNKNKKNGIFILVIKSEVEKLNQNSVNHILEKIL